MPSIQPISFILEIKLNNISKNEFIVFEAELFAQLCNKLQDYLTEDNKKFLYLIGVKKEMANMILESNFVQLLIKDILSTEEYTLKGIAYYLNTHEDVIYDIVIGKNSNPSSLILLRCIDLHKSVRPNLYKEISKKIIEDYLKQDHDLLNQSLII